MIAAPILSTQPYRQPSSCARRCGSATNSAITAPNTGRGASQTRPAIMAPTSNPGTVCSPAISTSTAAATSMVDTSVTRAPTRSTNHPHSSCPTAQPRP
ncbi:Uncharacterised protein [Mycobacterium tuberculosis]|uniref:Uncharacterized protein n=1 Tax=Mycobacterium tuberculosis TaxID=1773 RepID=A0A0U0QXD3_MYCTX|nr:Uncharacterised protein [Mycobacterium tuberculosis]